MPSREGSSFAHRYLGYGNEDYEKIMKRWRKEKSFAIYGAFSPIDKSDITLSSPRLLT